ALVRVAGLRRWRRLGSRRRCRRCRPRGEGARHAVDERVGVGQVVGVVAPEAARRPAQHGRPDVLCPRQGVVLAALVYTGGIRVPLVRGGGQCLLRGLVADGGGGQDSGRVVADGG